MYLSSDYGFSWNEQNSAMDKSSLDLARGKGIKRIVCSKANPSLCVFQGVISWFWLTDNAGVTYQIVDISDHFKRFNISYIDAMALNPQKESDILSIFVTDSCQNHLCQSMVATFDRGLTWIEVADAVLQGQWIQERDIMYLTYGSDGNTEASTTLYIYSFRDKKSQAILNDCVGFKVYDDKYLIAGQSHSGGQAVRLFYCVLVGSGCSAHELDTPRDLHYSRFSVLSVNKDRLYVNGNDGTTKLGDILLSKSFSKLERVLEYNFRDVDGRADFAISSNGLQETILANVVDHGQNNEGTDPERTTLISNNQGQTWSKILPNENDHKVCNSIDCGIHVHLNAAKQDLSHTPITPFECNEGGLCVAAGVVGTSLPPPLYVSEPGGSYGRYICPQCQTLLSQNMGQNWTNVHPATHVMSIGRSWSTIFSAPSASATQRLLVSTTYGEDFIECEMGKEGFVVTKIYNLDLKPSSAIVIGLQYTRNPTGRKGIAIAMDGSNIYPRACDTFDPKSVSSRDYESWYQDSTCLNGAKRTLWRRRATALCRVSDSRLESFQACSCTKDDYVCDVGYLDAGDKCVPEGPLPPPPSNCQGTYEIPSGYMKKPDSQCLGGFSPKPSVLNCPKSTKTESHLRLYLGAFILVLGIAGYFKFYKSLPRSLRRSKMEGKSLEMDSLHPSESESLLPMRDPAQDLDGSDEDEDDFADADWIELARRDSQFIEALENE
eukprot:TRINITY_DN4294_c0_g1_i2.p1 TRINITY_DN4294_c0_g1~~TRINITY_DN4294_c0_g1_i2.p1  ORF type:complete len:720 (-),score=103.28 TRINITY_DN4294_c0_g1_i2:55-2214(-)